jgi:hypothetical protein
MSLDTRWEDVDALLNRTTRSKDETLVRAVQEIVELRFKFPTPEHASYRAYANVPTVAMTVQVGDEQIAPDIVVVERLNTGDTKLVMTAAVVDKEGVTEGEAQRAWARYAAIPDQVFYLYVPVGYGAAAKRICKKLRIHVEGYRTWRTTPRGFEVNDISEPASPLAALMPPLIRKLLATP